MQTCNLGVLIVSLWFFKFPAGRRIFQNSLAEAMTSDLYYNIGCVRIKPKQQVWVAYYPWEQVWKLDKHRHNDK